jgi:hypothetical protein
MNMKKPLLFTAAILCIQISNAQTDSIGYFGQTLPGDLAVIFAPGIISLEDRLEGNITFAPDGNECFFTVHGLNYSTYKIFYTKRENNIWSPQMEAPFFTGQKNSNPFLSADGNTLYFDSQINSATSKRDIFMVRRTSQGWSDPQILPSPINSDYYDGCYSETSDSIVYFTSDRTGSQLHDIWYAPKTNGHPMEVENLGSKVNSNAYDYSSTVAHDGSFLIFTSTRLGAPDLYITFPNGSNGWAAPISMSKINTSAEESDPSLSPDGRFLFFTRGHAGIEPQDIYWVSTHILIDMKKTAFAPKLSKQIPTINLKTDTALNYVIPANTFSCEYGTETLKYTATLGNGSALPSWLSFNAETQTLSGIPHEPEIDTIKITATNKDTISASCTFKITVSSITSVNQIEEKRIEIFPNPTKGQFAVLFGSSPIQKAIVEAYNTEGKLIYTGIFRNTASANIDLTAYSKEMYVVKITFNDKTYNEKIFIE